VSSVLALMAERTICSKPSPPLSDATAKLLLRRLGSRLAPWMSKLT
jgi:hypothetical protein